MKAKSVLPQLLDFDQMQTQTCLPNDNAGDRSMPLLRDVKRFVRKCLKLSLLGIVGCFFRKCCFVLIPPLFLSGLYRVVRESRARFVVHFTSSIDDFED
jgi:hypothetical protein